MASKKIPVRFVTGNANKLRARRKTSKYLLKSESTPIGGGLNAQMGTRKPGSLIFCRHEQQTINKQLNKGPQTCVFLILTIVFNSRLKGGFCLNVKNNLLELFYQLSLFISFCLSVFLSVGLSSRFFNALSISSHLVFIWLCVWACLYLLICVLCLVSSFAYFFVCSCCCATSLLLKQEIYTNKQSNHS